MRTRVTPVDVRRRIAWILLASAGASVALGLRLFYLQVVRHGHYTRLALEQRLRPLPVDPRRGTIYDRQGNKLAISVSADAVYAIPSEVDNPGETARRLASLLNMPADELESRMRQRQAAVWLARRLDPEVARQIRALDLKGIGLVERPQRYYPSGPLAAHVLGVTGIDNQGLEGLEFYYDRYLRGVPGRVEAERDAAGREIPGGVSRYVPAQDGHSLVLTIDQVIQYRAEQELARKVQETQSDLGIFIAVEPATGAIRAMAVYPGFDPNHWADVPAERRRNVAVTDQFEPGSTFKIVTGAAALEAGVVHPEDRFFDPGFVLIGGGKVSCWAPGGHGSQSFVEATENSCNPVFAIIGAQRLGPEMFYRFIRAFGFGDRLGIDFPGEATGFVPVPGSVPYGEVLRWANIGFGQGVAVTPLQLVMAAATIANGGVLMRPRLVEEVRSADGQTVIEQMPPVALRRVLSPATAETFARIMRSVVVNGSGTRADIPGYRVAGKTGTAQIPAPGGGYGDDTMASFIGFAPVDRPRLVGLVMLYKLHVQPRWGGLWAAPTFAAIMGDSLRYLQVPRQEEKLPDPGKDSQGRQLVRVPNVRNLPVNEAEKSLAEAGLGVGVEGSGELVMEQVPKAGAVVPQGTRVRLVFERPPEAGGTSVTVPDLSGKSLRDVAAILSERGLTLHLTGSGLAVFQSPAPGVSVPVGTPVEVRFAPPQESEARAPHDR